MFFNSPAPPFWQRDSKTLILEKVQIPPPNFTKAGKVAIYVDSGDSIASATGCTPNFGDEIKNASANNKPTSLLGFQKMMMLHWTQTLKRKLRPTFDDNLAKVVEALGKGYVTYN